MQVQIQSQIGAVFCFVLSVLAQEADMVSLSAKDFTLSQKKTDLALHGQRTQLAKKERRGAAHCPIRSLRGDRRSKSQSPLPNGPLPSPTFPFSDASIDERKMGTATGAAKCGAQKHQEVNRPSGLEVLSAKARTATLNMKQPEFSSDAFTSNQNAGEALGQMPGRNRPSPTCAAERALGRPYRKQFNNRCCYC